MSPASITAFSTIVFGLTFAPMMTSNPETTPESTPSNDGHPQQTITFDNEAAQRGARREREMYEPTTDGPAIADMQEEESPYSRRIDREMIDLSQHPHADQRSGKPESQSRQHTSPNRTRQQHSSASMSRQHTNPHQQSSGQTVYTLSMPTHQQQHTAQNTRNTTRQSQSHASQPSQQHRNNSNSATVMYNASNNNGNTTTSDSGSSMPGRRPIDPKAEKIPAPGSNLGNSKAYDQAESKKNTTKKAAPSASAGKTDKQ